MNTEERRHRFKANHYYETRARFRHAEIKPEWIDYVLEEPEESVEDESNPAADRIRHRRFVPEAGYWVRVVTDPDGAVHNAFKDTDYTAWRLRQRR